MRQAFVGVALVPGEGRRVALRQVEALAGDVAAGLAGRPLEHLRERASGEKDEPAGD